MSEIIIDETDHSILTRRKWQGQEVAVKTSLRSNDPRSAERWQNEVEALKKVSGHPHVTCMLDSCSAPFSITLRLEHGRMLASFVDSDQESTLSRQDHIILLAQMSQALSFVHSKGLVHDDVKPENIMWSPAIADVPARAVLIDFGACFVSTGGAAADFTMSGTPPYVAPEFLAKQKSPAVDAWALGVTMLFVMGAIALPDGNWFLPDVFVEGEARAQLLGWQNGIAEAREVLLTAASKETPRDATMHVQLLVARLLHDKPEERLIMPEACAMVEDLVSIAHN